MTTDAKAPDAPESTAPVPVRQAEGDVIAYYERILDGIPDAGGAGIENILEQIAQAADTAGLDEPWRAGGLGKWVDQQIVIQSIRKMPSDFGSGLSFFLVVEGAVRATGEKVTATTGSLSVVAQLLKAWELGTFPVLVVPRLSKRPTKEGYYPQHLEFVQA